MTEKRYTILNMGLNGRFIKENGKIIEINKVVDLLNENEKLKQQNKQLKNKVDFLEDLVDSEYSIDNWEEFYKKYNNSDINDNK